METINASMKAKSVRMNKLKELLRLADLYQDTKSIYDEWKGIRWKGKREKFELEHERDLKTFRMARRKLGQHLSPAGKAPVQSWRQELASLQQEYQTEYEQYKPIRDELWRLQQVKRCTDAALHNQERIQEKRRTAER